jgi:transposase InsO family protein
LNFDLLCRLSSLDLIQGLSKLKFEKYFVCHPCRHGKMIVASHSPITKVMTSHPGQLLHIDTFGPVRVCSFGGQWYVLVVVDDFSRYSWVFFMTTKDEAFTHAQDLILRLQNEFPKNAMRAIRRTMAHNSKILNLQPFVHLWDSSISFPLRMCPSRMVLLNAKIGPLLRWTG